MRYDVSNICVNCDCDSYPNNICGLGSFIVIVACF